MADDEGALAQLGIRKGQIAEGTALLGRGLTVWEEGGGRVGSPYLKSVLAEGMAELGNITRALDLVDEAIVQIERPGWEERYYYAEVLRIRGWLLSLRGDPAAAERAYIASLDWARQQQAKSWELRTATSYPTARSSNVQSRSCREGARREDLNANRTLSSVRIRACTNGLLLANRAQAQAQ